MEDTDGSNFTPTLRREFTGGAYSNYRVKAGPPWIRFAVTPEKLEFHGRGLMRVFRLGPWTIPRQEVKEVFAKRRNPVGTFSEIEIVTTDPSVWWVFWPSQDAGQILLALEECGYPVEWTPHNWAGLPNE